MVKTKREIESKPIVLDEKVYSSDGDLIRTIKKEVPRFTRKKLGG